MTHLHTSLSTTAPPILPKLRKLTGNLNFRGHLHYSAHPVPHDAAVVAGVRPVQRGDQVPEGHIQGKQPLVGVSVMDRGFGRPDVFIPSVYHRIDQGHLKLNRVLPCVNRGASERDSVLIKL